MFNIVDLTYIHIKLIGYFYENNSLKKVLNL